MSKWSMMRMLRSDLKQTPRRKDWVGIASKAFSIFFDSQGEESLIHQEQMNEEMLNMITLDPKNW